MGRTKPPEKNFTLYRIKVSAKDEQHYISKIDMNISKYRKEEKNMAKLADLLVKTSAIKEGKYTAHIISINKADPVAYDNKNVPVILKVKFPELAGRVQNIFLNTKKDNADDMNIYERTMVDLERQLQTGANLDTDQIESIDINFKGKDVDCYVCNVLSSDGKIYTNYYFNKENKHVKAMLMML